MQFAATEFIIVHLPFCYSEIPDMHTICQTLNSRKLTALQLKMLSVANVVQYTQTFYRVSDC